MLSNSLPVACALVKDLVGNPDGADLERFPFIGTEERKQIIKNCSEYKKLQPKKRRRGDRAGKEPERLERKSKEKEERARNVWGLKKAARSPHALLRNLL